jgi:hypothetical protein
MAKYFHEKMHKNQVFNILSLKTGQKGRKTADGRGQEGLGIAKNN